MTWTLSQEVQPGALCNQTHCTWDLVYQYSMRKAIKGYTIWRIIIQIEHTLEYGLSLKVFATT